MVGQMSDYRNFSVELEALADRWNDTVETSDAWDDQGEQAKTESRPRKVQCGPVLGVAKPGVIKNDGVCRAAHEKITSDLAYLLELPVPPVILWDRGTQENAAQHVSISAWAFSPAVTWDEAQAHLREDEHRLVEPAVSAMLAFETWIGATDHKSDHLLVNLHGTGLQLAFIDYAYSLSHSWKSPEEPIGPPHGYVPVPRDDAAVAATVALIENFGEDVINRIVNRIPQAYLPTGNHDVIISNLTNRRTKLRDALNV